jgi:hypothetical protein
MAQMLAKILTLQQRTNKIEMATGWGPTSGSVNTVLNRVLLHHSSGCFMSLLVPVLAWRAATLGVAGTYLTVAASCTWSFHCISYSPPQQHKGYQAAEQALTRHAAA